MLRKKEKLREEQQLENLRVKLGVEVNVDSSSNDDKNEGEENKIMMDVGKEKSEEEKKQEEDKELEESNASLKLIVLETVGKCWSYSSEVQGLFGKRKSMVLKLFVNITDLKTVNFFSEPILFY